LEQSRAELVEDAEEEIGDEGLEAEADVVQGIPHDR